MAARHRTINPISPRPAHGRLVFYTRDSGGKHETTPSEYVRHAARFARKNGLTFSGSPEGIDQMIKAGEFHCGDLFLDWDVTGNKMSRRALDALYAEIEKDRSVSHVYIPRTDRLARPNQIQEGLELEDKFVRMLGVALVLGDRVIPPLKRGQKRELGDVMLSAFGYDRAEKDRHDLAQKAIDSQSARARNGFSSGGRAKYGLQRWLMAPTGALTAPWTTASM